MSLAVGSQVAQYRLERLLGTGGMGEVYLAHDSRLDRSVAIKFLTSFPDQHARRRLLHEARAAAALDHQGICAVYEVGSDPAAGDFIAMQYIEGESLADRLRRGRLRPDEALSLGAHVAEALVAAHRRGIVHRDLKPQNIMITPAGAPKLLDFGLATHAPNSAAAANAATTSQLGEPHTIAGTPAYMSPEQARNEPVDYRSDVFALGCVLYECLTGRRAFAGGSTAETLGQVLHVDPAPISTVVPDVGSAYDGLCARLLHKMPDERFQSAEEVLGAIRALTPSARLSASGAAPAPPRGRTLSVRQAILVGVAISTLGYLGYWAWPRGPAVPVAPPEARQWYDRGVEAMRDGTYAAARSAFAQAIDIFPSYAEAHWRLAEAHIAIEDERHAQQALIRGEGLVPNKARLRPDDRLRYEAARAATLRDHDAAIRAYRGLADLQPEDAGRWLDAGRAEEAGGRFQAARESYEKAASLDKQSAAAHLRSGVLMARVGLAEAGLAAIDESIRLHRASGKTEGEAEGLVRRGMVLVANPRLGDARQAFEAVLQLAGRDRYPAQRVGAEFGLARLDYNHAAFAEAEGRARQAVADATSAGLQTIAAAGLLALGNALLGQGQYEAADAQYAKAIELAAEHGASRQEMMARMQQAALRVQTSRPEEALSLVAVPLKYFSERGEELKRAEASLIMSRAEEALERYDDAGRMAAEALRFAETAKDSVVMGYALENLAGQLTKLGRLPEALTYRERIDDLHRRPGSESALPFDLANHAELLILLGRAGDAEALLQEVEAGIARQVPSYVQRRPRVALLRALLASTERRWAEVGRELAHVPAAGPAPAGAARAKPSYTQLYARILAEHALAHLGRSRTPAGTVAGWPAEAATSADRREFSYWVGQTLLAKGDPHLAGQVAGQALAEPAARANSELAWRLAAVAARAADGSGAADKSASIASQARTLSDQLGQGWGGAGAAYFARPDLVELRKGVR